MKILKYSHQHKKLYVSGDAEIATAEKLEDGSVNVSLKDGTKVYFTKREIRVLYQMCFARMGPW